MYEHIISNDILPTLMSLRAASYRQTPAPDLDISRTDNTTKLYHIYISDMR